MVYNIEHCNVLDPHTTHTLSPPPTHTHTHSSDPSKWLELVSNHLLRRLVYIDIGVGYQLLRLEFRTDQLACYSFILRDEDKCTIISTKLACELHPLPPPRLFDSSGTLSAAITCISCIQFQKFSDFLKAVERDLLIGIIIHIWR